jgi:tetratricopeptide (TPR) repeat protein
MHRITPKLALLLTCITITTSTDAQQTELGTFRISAGAIVIFHLVKTYESCPVGTVLRVKISAAVDSQVNKSGEPVHGVLARPLACNNQTFLVAGTEVTGDFEEFGGQGDSPASYYGIEIKMVEAGEKSHWLDAITPAPRPSAATNSVAIQKGAGKKEPVPAKSRARKPAPDPFSDMEIAGAFVQGKPSHSMATEIERRGIDFYFDESEVAGFQIVGAGDEALDAIRHARFVYMDHNADPAERNSRLSRLESVFRTAQTKRADDLGLHMWLGIVLQSEGDNGGAILELQKAIAGKPDLVYAHEMLGNALYYSGKKDDGISELLAAVRLNPNAARLHVELGYLLSSKGDLQAALPEAQEAVRDAPTYFAAHLVLGTLLASEKNIADAEGELREAVRENPESEGSHFVLGTVLFAKPDYDGAVAELAQAARLHPKDPTVHLWVARALYRSGHYDEAASEVRVALLYNPKAQGAKEMLASLRSSLDASATPAAARQPSAPPPQATAGPLAGSTWTCQWRKVFPENYVTTQPTAMSYSITFLDSGIARKNGTTWTDIGTEATWQLNGAAVTILTPGNAAANFEGTLTSPTTIEARGVFKENSVDVHDEFLNCARQTPIAPPASAAPVSESAPAGSNHPPYDDKCIRLGRGNLGAVTFTNICSEPIDLKWCYRKHGSGEAWTCQAALRLLQNHTLSSPFCYQCSYDGRAAAYLSSRNLTSMLPSDQEVASWSDSGAPQAGSANSPNSGVPNDGMRRWKIVNPSQNWDTVYLEVRGRSGESTSDDWNDETAINTLSLAPGGQQLLTCGQWFSLDIRWYTTSSSNPQTDVYYVSLICYANNFVWNNNHNLREYDFPRQ